MTLVSGLRPSQRFMPRRAPGPGGAHVLWSGALAKSGVCAASATICPAMYQLTPNTFLTRTVHHAARETGRSANRLFVMYGNTVLQRTVCFGSLRPKFGTRYAPVN